MERTVDVESYHDHPEPPSIRSRIRFRWSEVKKDIVAVLGELLGTIFFLWVAFAGTSFVQYQVLTASAVGTSAVINVLFISLVFGFSLAINVWIFFRVSGGLFNPAITFALMLFGFIPFIRGLWLIVAQFSGGIIAAALVQVMLYPIPLGANTNLLPILTPVRGLFIEAIVTTMLILTVFMLAAEKSRATFLAPIGIGLALFVSQLSCTFFTGSSVNPARSLGPAVVTNIFPSYFWIYVVGPFLGALFASTIYGLFRMLEYHTALPDQDTEVARKPTSNEEERKELDV